MKKKTSLDSSFFSDCNLLNHSMLGAIKGGVANSEDDYELIYIDGKPYLVKKNSNGQIIEMRPLYSS
jgi:hypothetical protein